MNDLFGKTAVITGGASGIGLALAEACGARGMKLVLADIESDALARAVAGLRGAGHEAVGVRTDVAKLDEMEALAKATVEAFGAAHLVVNNAGVSITGPIWEMSLDDWRWVFDVNVWGVVNGVKTFAPRLLAQGEGHIVNVSSLAGFGAIGHHAPYCASKWAVVAMSLALHSELKATGRDVGASVVCPGFVDTQIHRSWRNRPEADEPWSRRDWDLDVRARNDAFQAQGVPPEDIARLTLEAVEADRFWVFNSPGWETTVARVRDLAIAGQNPPVRTWGPDLRSEALRAADAAPPGQG